MELIQILGFNEQTRLSARLFIFEH